MTWWIPWKTFTCGPPSLKHPGPSKLRFDVTWFHPNTYCTNQNTVKTPGGTWTWMSRALYIRDFVFVRSFLLNHVCFLFFQKPFTSAYSYWVSIFLWHTTKKFDHVFMVVGCPSIVFLLTSPKFPENKSQKMWFKPCVFGAPHPPTLHAVGRNDSSWMYNAVWMNACRRRQPRVQPRVGG